MSGDKPSQRETESEEGSNASGSPQGSAVSAAAGGAPPPPARPVIRHLDVEVRDAYRKTFGQEAGDVTSGRSALGDYRVTVLDPNGKEIPGIGQTREAAFDNLIDRIKSAGPEEA
jgi:hypothetical protein